jgi:hypothetical protein
MVNIDLSRIVPDRALDFLAYFMPGFFFELAIAIGNPALVQSIGARFYDHVPMYLAVAIASFAAFVIGTAFMLLDTFIRFVWAFIYRSRGRAWVRLWKWMARQLSAAINAYAAPSTTNASWWQWRPRWWKSRLIPKLCGYAYRKGFPRDQVEEQINWCWHVLARQLLKVRYGINVNDGLHGNEFLDGDHFQYLNAVLGAERSRKEWRGELLLVTVHATGWAGVVAMRIAPVLRNWYFRGLCYFLILQGLLNAYFVIKAWYDPQTRALRDLRAVVLELQRLAGKGLPQPAAPDADGAE